MARNLRCGGCRMSGICGICEPGLEIPKWQLESMLPALTLPGESSPEIRAGRSLGVSVAPRWVAQELFECADALLVADTDLTNWRAITDYLESKGFVAQGMSRGELLTRLYFVDGPEFVK